MKKIRKICTLSVMSLMIIVALQTSISAQYNNQNFSGRVGYNYGYVSNGGVNKVNSYRNFTVNWKQSSISNIKMWFKMVNSNEVNRGKGLLGYLEKQTISASPEAWKNYNYWLMAGREHFGNPSAKIDGIWTP